MASGLILVLVFVALVSGALAWIVMGGLDRAESRRRIQRRLDRL